MRNLYIALAFVIAGSCLHAQNKDTAKADKLFASYEYVDAAGEYLKLVDKGKADNYVYLQLADAYFNMFNTVDAAKWYAMATQEKQDPEIYYRYAQMLKANGKYEDANKQMRKFAEYAPNDTRAIAFMQNPNYVPRLMDKEKLYTAKRLEVSGDNSDFGPILYGSEFYFTSARNAIRKNYGWNDQPFLDLYKGEYNADGTITNAETVTDLNSQYHDGPLTISKDGNTAYFVSDSFREKSFERDRKNRLKLGKNNIFRAVKEDGKWKNITSLPFNSNEYSTSAPSLSRDGKTLYFSSNMPGSIGGVDIWKVSINADATYGAPENLGRKVNTEGDESFPFIADDNNTLYFASSGRQGLGGLDVFKVELNGSAEATNLGTPVNSEKDDFSFTFNAEKNLGFFASNRTGNDDLYAATPICGVDLITKVTNAKDGSILANASVAIVDDKKNVITTEMSNAKGEVTFRIECNKSYTIQASKDGFESNTFPVAATTNAKSMIDAALNPIDKIITPEGITLNTIYFEFDKSNVTREGAFELDKLVQVMQKNPAMVIMVKSHTDNRGSAEYNMRLSDRRAKSTVQYVRSKGIPATRISGKGYGESEPKVDCGETCTEEQHAMNRRSEFLIVK